MLATVVVAAAVALSGCGQPVSSADTGSQQAQEKAAELRTALESAGLTPPSVGVITALYGVDGGWSCVAVNNRDMHQGFALFGSAGSGLGRRVVMDPSVIAYDRAVIATYCPGESEAFADYVEGLRTESTRP